jgi:phospholipase C
MSQLAFTKPARVFVLALLLSQALIQTVSAATEPSFAMTSLAQSVKPAGRINTITPIQHFVVLMEEDRSFDSYFANFPGTSAIADSGCVAVGPTPDNCQKPYPLDARSLEKLSESQRKYSSLFTLGHYTDQEVPFFWNVAEQYVLFDHYFSSVKSISGAISPNKLYAIAGTASASTKITTGGYDRFTTIFDRLQAKGVSWKMYVQDYDAAITFRSVKAGDKVPKQLNKVPLLSFGRFIDDPQLAANIVDLDEYYADLKSGSLPAVSYLVANGAGEPTSSSLLVGQRHLKTVMQALMRSSVWNTSALLWTHDQSGGWYDHVAPPQMDNAKFGLRVPAMLISPFVRPRQIDSTVLEHSSIIKFIQHNWSLEPLGQQVTTANNFLTAFDFTQVPRPAEYLPMSRVVMNHAPVDTPNRMWIFVLYGAAWLIGSGVIVVLLIGVPGGMLKPSTPISVASPRQSISSS